MIKPILACQNPFQTAKKLSDAGWHIVFSNPPESGDPLVGVSLCGNVILLGITEGYVPEGALEHVGCGIEIYMTVPCDRIQEIHRAHHALRPTPLSIQPWGDLTFEVNVDGYQMMIASEPLDA